MLNGLKDSMEIRLTWNHSKDFVRYNEWDERLHAPPVEDRTPMAWAVVIVVTCEFLFGTDRARRRR